MNTTIEKTRLWANSLGSKDADQNTERLKERLRSALWRFREHAGVLTSRISATFPQLTVHDVSHLDALWETADQIAGDDYPLNPLEAFVFGGAILLHDAAHCFEAYEGGKQGVRNTSAWRDAFACELAAHPLDPRERLEEYSDFAAIRLLHAREAERLGEREWKSKNDDTSFFLLEDSELRTRYGALIGQIGASHNWNIEDVKSRLRTQVNAPGDWPGDWRVDPIKIACLLRCADAAHLDNRRAPDFLLALMRRSGVSLDHWKAQNWLAKVDADQADPGKTSLIFTSTHAFESKDATAWWVAYDAICILDAEIKASNSLLLSRVQKDRGSPPFRMQRVTGANSPSELSKSVETKGWMPTSAKIHVGNVQRLVATLGGKFLYGDGDNFAIVMRELIQNARDAIAARKALGHNFSGHVFVTVTRKSDRQTFVEIRDNGVGMSERTMTGTLLDFGTSFWASDLVRAEFPGLRSSSFKPVGTFGIGFYAIFMIASEVVVISRRFDDGSSDVTRMHFPDGLTLRPILSKGPDERYDMTYSTCVRLTVNEPIDCVSTRWINKGQVNNEWQLSLEHYLAAITAGLDVEVALQIENGAIRSVHDSIKSIDTPEKILRWIEGIAFVDVPNIKNGAALQKYVRDNAGRIRAIEVDGHIVGRAALLDVHGGGFQFLTTDTVGGLTNNVARGAGGYMGYMDCYPSSAKRDAANNKVAPVDVLERWANEQISILKGRNASLEQLYWAASNMANLGIDPIDVISFPVFFQDNRYVLLTIDQVIEVLNNSAMACLRSKNPEFADANSPPVALGGLPTLRPVSNGNLIQAQIENGKPKFPASLIGCLDRLAQRKGFELIYEVRPTDIRTFTGEMDALIIKLKKPE